MGTRLPASMLGGALITEYGCCGRSWPWASPSDVEKCVLVSLECVRSCTEAVGLERRILKGKLSNDFPDSRIL